MINVAILVVIIIGIMITATNGTAKLMQDLYIVVGKEAKRMIKVRFLTDCKDAEKFGTCVSCGKNSKDDPKMVRVTYSYHEGRCRTSICLCDECRYLLFKKI